jgi:two-component system sensor histidine kinase CpxA
MRSLFAKIFTCFLLISLIAGVAMAMISYFAQIGPYGEMRKRVLNHHVKGLTHTLSVAGLAVEELLQNCSRQQVLDYLRQLETADSGRIFLMDLDNRTFTGRSAPRELTGLVAAALDSGRVQHSVTDTEIMVALPVAAADGTPRVLVGTASRISWPPAAESSPDGQSRSGLPLSHIPMGLPLLIMLAIGGLGCFLLARSLTAPIRSLRRAVQQMAGGNFTVRVDLPTHRQDELTDLGRDINTMAERTQELLDSQKRLLRDISHELRSPLTRQNMALELARRNPAQSGPYLDRIAQESDRLNTLIGQLLLLTRLESEVDPAINDEISLRELVNTIVRDADFEAAGSGRGIKTLSLDDVPLSGSAELLGRALENVIRNGLRYTAPGTSVEISTAVRDNRVTIRVRDHGPGVPQEHLEKLFKPFFRVADARERDSGGTGIGLAIARQAVLLHGGSITADNDPQGGLVVTITLPVAAP